jgi:hypothetical protein
VAATDESCGAHVAAVGGTRDADDVAAAADFADVADLADFADIVVDDFADVAAAADFPDVADTVVVGTVAGWD